MPSDEGGWHFRLQCTVCGFRVRRHKDDYRGALGDQPQATIEIPCSNCTANAGHPRDGEVVTTHFIDYARTAEAQ